MTAGFGPDPEVGGGGGGGVWLKLLFWGGMRVIFN